MSKKEVVKPDEMQAWDSLQEMIDYFNHGISAAMLTLTRIMWEAGRAGNSLKTESKYGDNAISEFSEGINKGTSWVYECIKMYDAYTWADIKGKFLKAGVPASSIARLGSIKDEGARNYVEDKLIKGDITYEEIGAAKKEYETIVDNPNVGHNDIGDGSDQTIEERTAAAAMDPDDPNNVAASIIRAHFGKLSRSAEEQIVMMEDTLVAHDKLGDISDTSLYEISQDRIVLTAVTLQKQIGYITNIVDTLRKLAPDQFEES